MFNVSVQCLMFNVQWSVFSVQCLQRCCIVLYNVCQSTGIYIKKYFILYFLCFLFLAHVIVYRIFTCLRFKYKIEGGGEGVPAALPLSFFLYFTIHSSSLSAYSTLIHSGEEIFGFRCIKWGKFWRFFSCKNPQILLNL